MRGALDLNGPWLVSWTEGLHGSPDHGHAAACDGGRYLEVAVPGELHQELRRLGLAEDPNIGLNSLHARWIEEQYWLYRRSFTAPEEALNRPTWLVFEGLDLNADIYLNGERVGGHANGHRPCRVPVTGKLRAGQNLLSVRLESGLYGVADRPGSAYCTQPETLLNKRHWLRKAQYQCGWDWNPRLMAVGITGGVRLEWSDEPWVEQMVVSPELAADHSHARLHVRVFALNPTEVEVGARLRLRCEEAGAETEAEVSIAPGESCLEGVLEVAQPRLWWPVGHGEQPLYTVEASLLVGDRPLSSATRRTGIRDVRINQEPHPEEGHYFILEVNGRPIFCKGGNWVPPDMLAATVEEGRYRELVDLAVRANCNLLRVWGGGTYAPRAFLDGCDEAGVLVWHDLLFACARYPGDDAGFLAEVRAEVTWAMRELASHPSLAVWCGNNELEWGAWDWGYDQAGRTLPDYGLYHHVIPVIAKREDPRRPFWPSSPYSADHEPPNSPTTGDQHPWGVTLGPHRTDFWAYRSFVDRFPNEGGVLGASSPATLRQCLPGQQFRLRSPAWEHHDNAANFWAHGEGVTYEAVRRWLGRDPAEMPLEEYCFASALLQAEGLQEYIANYRRRMFTSAAAVFWMYNDSWPATHGWTIVDYYRRRKLAYHPVRRAFGPVTVVVAEDGDAVRVFGVNDGPREWRGQLRSGLFVLDGALPVDREQEVVLAANASTPLAEVPRADWERLGLARAGAFALLLRKGEVVAQHRLLLTRFSELALGAPQIEVRLERGVATFSSPGFVWGVCLDEDGEAPLADDCFDLLPGIPHTMPWSAGLPEPRVQRTGNGLVVG